MKRLSLLFVTLFAGLGIQGQSIYLNYFEGIQINEKIQLIWEVQAGSTCDGIKIQRAFENTPFIEIGKIEGICGSGEFAVKYAFTDEQADINGNYFYRLRFGNGETSDTVSVQYVDFHGADYLILGNPVAHESILRFKNPNALTVKLTLYDQQGRPISKQSTNTESFKITEQENGSGWYYFELIPESQNQQAIKGKIFIL